MVSPVVLAERWAISTWALLVDSALLLLVGIGLAGLIHAVLDQTSIRRFLGRRPKAQVFRSALLGVPLTLCSCSVLPVAYELRRSGLGRGGTVSFLISTPETGIDSILLTYSLMDPLLTVARPVTALVTAVVAGLTETAFEKSKTIQTEPAVIETCAVPDSSSRETRKGGSMSVRSLWSGLRYGYSDLLNDLAPYLLLGYLLAGLVGAILGGTGGELPEWLQGGWAGYVGAIVIGLPLYICATSSTPLAAALLAAGFSPGAMLVFMIVGPATNIASLIVLRKILRGWALARYLLVIVTVALLAGLAVDRIYDFFGLAPSLTSPEQVYDTGWMYGLSAAVLAALIITATGRKAIRRLGL